MLVTSKHDKSLSSVYTLPQIKLSCREELLFHYIIMELAVRFEWSIIG